MRKWTIRFLFLAEDTFDTKRFLGRLKQVRAMNGTDKNNEKGRMDGWKRWDARIVTIFYNCTPGDEWTLVGMKLVNPNQVE